MTIKVHKDKCGYWVEWERENKIVSASLVELVEAYENKPIRKGRWKGTGMGDYMCSWCGEIVSGNKYTYCPYCGIPMNKDDEIGEDKSHPFAESVMMGKDEEDL